MTVQEDISQSLTVLSAAGQVVRDTTDFAVDAYVKGSLTANVEHAAAALRGNEALLAKRVLGEVGFLKAPAHSVNASATCVTTIRSTFGGPLKPTMSDEQMKAALWAVVDDSADLTVVMGMVSSAADYLDKNELEDAIWCGLLGRATIATAETTVEMHRVAREVIRGLGPPSNLPHYFSPYKSKWAFRRNAKLVDVAQALTELIKGSKTFLVPKNLRSALYFERLAVEGIAPCVEARVSNVPPDTCTLVVEPRQYEKWSMTRLNPAFATWICGNDDDLLHYQSKCWTNSIVQLASKVAEIGLSDNLDLTSVQFKIQEDDGKLREIQLSERERQDIETVGGCLSKIILTVMDHKWLIECNCGHCKDAIIKYSCSGIQEHCKAVESLHDRVRNTLSTLVFSAFESYRVMTYELGGHLYDSIIEDLASRCKRRWYNKVHLLELCAHNRFEDDDISFNDEYEPDVDEEQTEDEENQLDDEQHLPEEEDRFLDKEKEDGLSRGIAVVWQDDVVLFGDVRWALACGSGRKYLAISCGAVRSFDFRDPIQFAYYGTAEHMALAASPSPKQVDKDNEYTDIQPNVWYDDHRNGGGYYLVGMSGDVNEIEICNPGPVGKISDPQQQIYFAQSGCTHPGRSISATVLQWNEEVETGTGLIRAHGNPLARFAAMCVKRSKPTYIQRHECLYCSLRNAKASGCAVIID
jgi:hypothetical protein